MPALNPDAQIRPDEIIDDPELFPDPLPREVSKSGDFYAIKKQLADGRIAIEWYKRGRKLAEGQAPQDPVIARSQGYAKAVADEYAKQQQQQGQAATQTQTIGGRVKQWNPTTNTYDIDLGPAGTTTQTPAQAAADTATAALNTTRAQAAEAETAELARNEAAGRGRVTDAQWLAENDRQQQHALATQNAAEANRLNQAKLQFDRDREAQRAREAAQTATLAAQDREISKGTGPGGADQRIVRGSDGSITYEPIPGSEGKNVLEPLPPGVPQFIPDLTRVDLGLSDRRRQLEALITNKTITKAQALQALTADDATAKAAGTNAGAIINIQEGNRAAGLTARGQDITDAASRRSFAGSTFNQTMSTLAPIATQFVPGPGAGEAAARGFEAMLGMARSHAGASGGMAAPPAYDPSQYPMLEGYGRAGIPGLPGGPPLGTQWTFGPNGPAPGPAGGAPGTLPGRLPLPAPTAPAGGPNAIGLGAIGNVPAPGGLPGPQPLPGPPPGAGPGPMPLPGPPPGAGPAPVPLPGGPPVRDDWRLPANPGPAAGLLRQSWAQQAIPSYDPRMSGLDEDFLRTGFDPDVIGTVMSRWPRLG